MARYSKPSTDALGALAEVKADAELGKAKPLADRRGREIPNGSIGPKVKGKWYDRGFN